MEEGEHDGKKKSRSTMGFIPIPVAIASWLRKHGKAVRPELSRQQRAEMRECFNLIDSDGSGSIGTDEMAAAFKFMGLRVSSKDLAAMVAEVDRDKSGEVEYQEFVEIMTNTVTRQTESTKSAGKKSNNALSFPLLATAYRRRKLMQAMLSGDAALRQKMTDDANRAMVEIDAMKEEEDMAAEQKRAKERRIGKPGAFTTAKSIDPRALQSWRQFQHSKGVAVPSGTQQRGESRGRVNLVPSRGRDYGSNALRPSSRGPLPYHPGAMPPNRYRKVLDQGCSRVVPMPDTLAHGQPMIGWDPDQLAHLEYPEADPAYFPGAEPPYSESPRFQQQPPQPRFQNLVGTEAGHDPNSRASTPGLPTRPHTPAGGAPMSSSTLPRTVSHFTHHPQPRATTPKAHSNRPPSFKYLRAKGQIPKLTYPGSPLTAGAAYPGVNNVYQVLGFTSGTDGNIAPTNIPIRPMYRNAADRAAGM